MRLERRQYHMGDLRMKRRRKPGGFEPVHQDVQFYSGEADVRFTGESELVRAQFG